MIYVSDIFNEKPKECKTELQKNVYSFLEENGISFSRIETSEIITMDDCKKAEEKLNAEMVKTLFLANKHESFLFITRGSKPFSSKDFSGALQIPRVSFARFDIMESVLGTKIGAATVFSVLLKSAENVRIVFDKEILKNEFYCCSDGTTTGYLKLKTTDITDVLLKNRTFDTVEV